MSSTVEKVRRLIALAASDSPEEARTAAFQACRLIREHEMVVTGKHAAPFPDPPIARGERHPGESDFNWARRSRVDWGAPSSPFEDIYEAFRRYGIPHDMPFTGENRTRHHYPPPPPPSQPGPPPEAPFVCVFCGGAIDPMSQHMWNRPLGKRFHMRCSEKPRSSEPRPRPSETRTKYCTDTTTSHECWSCAGVIPMGEIHLVVMEEGKKSIRVHVTPDCIPPGVEQPSASF